MSNTLLINKTFKFNQIQQIRLVHALTESDFAIAIPPSEDSKFSLLKDKFEVSFSNHYSNPIDITDQLQIVHSEPLTSLGSLSKSLVFPSIIPQHCRFMWQPERRFRYSFQGLVTEKRKSLIEGWISKNISASHKLPDTNSRIYNFRKDILSKLGIDYTIKKNIGDLLLWSSDRGRRFPIKAWDENYFRVLANSQYVLCPSGDYIWSYRFFEAALCGAIPIVEKPCKAYEGFKYVSFEDDVRELVWNLEVAEHNYALCAERITIPKTELNDALMKIVEPLSASQRTLMSD